MPGARAEVAVILNMDPEDVPPIEPAPAEYTLMKYWLPAVSPVAFRLVVPHATELSVPHVPEKSWILVPDELRFVPTEVNNTVRLVAEGVNLYHTSSSGVPVAQSTGMPVLVVASHTVPDEFVTPLESVIAEAHSSLEGGGVYVIQILKFHFELGVEVGNVVVNTLR